MNDADNLHIKRKLKIRNEITIRCHTLCYENFRIYVQLMFFFRGNMERPMKKIEDKEEEKFFVAFSSKTVCRCIGLAQSTYVPRVPQCLSPRRNWDSPTPLPLANVSAPPPRPPTGNKEWEFISECGAVPIRTTEPIVIKQFHPKEGAREGT